MSPITVMFVIENAFYLNVLSGNALLVYFYMDKEVELLAK